MRSKFRAYAAVAQAAKSEVAVSQARVDKLTPLPKIPKDKETCERVKSLRSKYSSITKSAKVLAATCASKMRSLESTIEKTVKAAIKKERDGEKKKRASKKRGGVKVAPKKRKSSSSSSKSKRTNKAKKSK
jgi:hypothetical protein